jgi:hypothetical protein
MLAGHAKFIILYGDISSAKEKLQKALAELTWMRYDFLSFDPRLLPRNVIILYEYFSVTDGQM